MLKRSMLAIAVMALLPEAALAADPVAGKAKAVVCAGCHGVDGKAIAPIYPNLAGQNAAYLESSMKAYRAKERSGGQAAVMYGMAAGLTDDDIANLAAYFSGL
jgi:cytochrome c553